MLTYWSHSDATDRPVSIWRVLSRIFAIARLSSLAVLCLLAASVSSAHAFEPNEVTREVDARLASLGVQPGSMHPVSQQVLQVREALMSADYSGATRLSEAVLQDSAIMGWRFRPFDEFLALLLFDVPSGFSDRLDTWVEREQSSVIPPLLRAQFNHDLAWAARGSGYADTVNEAEAAAYARHLRAAHADLDAASARDPAVPTLHLVALRIARSQGDSTGFRAAYNRAVELFPDYYAPYEEMLNTVQPKWGGSFEQMVDFVQEVAHGEPVHSPLKLLYLDLYQLLLETGATYCRFAAASAPAPCLDQLMEELVTPELDQGVLEALSLYDHTDPYQFGLEILSTISAMQTVGGGERFTGAILERAAIAMHSDTALTTLQPVENDYVIDALVAQSWARQGFEDNADKKYRDAIKSLRNSGLSHEDRRSAEARLYQMLARMAFDRGDYLDQTAFGLAALYLGMPWEAHMICRAYVELEVYDKAIDACTEAVELTDSSTALYWRGVAHDRLGEEQAAIVDLTAAADRSDYWAAYAAVAMSLIYFGRDDLTAALEVLNRYPVLYDADRTSASQVAVGYNNRCYALMELGDLEGAMRDCTQSLQYGNLPDAFRKQQELAEKLKAAE